jgi:hypothetical protein
MAEILFTTFNTTTGADPGFQVRGGAFSRTRNLVYDWLIDFWCFNVTFNNISAISWRPVLVVEEAGVPGENHRHPGFQVRGGALKKIAPSGGRRENVWGISWEKSRFYAKKSYLQHFYTNSYTF